MHTEREAGSDRFRELLERGARFVWGEVNLERLPRPRRFLIVVVRFIHAIVRDLAQGDLHLRAASLVYTTLLSLVPLLALAFSLLKAFGVHNQLEPLLLRLLEPLGDKSAQIVQAIVGFVDKMNVAALGAVGLATLLYTVVSVMQKIESAFNNIWRVKRQRDLPQRFGDYLSVLLVGPLLVFAAVGITATLMNNQVTQWLSSFPLFGSLLELVTLVLPYLMVIGAFTFIYVFMPNTHVRLRSAFVGAVVAGILWQTTGWIFARFVAGSAQYAAVYSTFAGLFIFMIWIYLAWLILLVGANIAYYHQHPEQLAVRTRAPALSIREREVLALMVMQQIALRFYTGGKSWTLSNLARAMQLPEELLASVLDPLEQSGILQRTGDTEARYLPGRPLEATTLATVLQAIRSAGSHGLIASRLGEGNQARLWLDACEGEARAEFLGRSVKSLTVVETQPQASEI